MSENMLTLEEFREFPLNFEVLDLLAAVNSIGIQRAERRDVFEEVFEHNPDQFEVESLLFDAVDVLVGSLDAQEVLKHVELDVVSYPVLLDLDEGIEPFLRIHMPNIMLFEEFPQNLEGFGLTAEETEHLADFNRHHIAILLEHNSLSPTPSFIGPVFLLFSLLWNSNIIPFLEFGGLLRLLEGVGLRFSLGLC